MTTQNADAYTEALELALGRVIADYQQQVDLHRAESAAVIADLRASLVEGEAKIAAHRSALEQVVRTILDDRLAEVERRVSTVLEAQRPDIDGIADALSGVFREVSRQVAEEAVAKIEMPAPPDLGGLATREDVEALAARIDDIPAPVEPDLSAFATREDVDVVRQAIPEKVELPDLSGFATKEDVDAIRMEIPATPDLSGFASKEAVDAAMELIDGLDLSGFATLDKLASLRKEIPELPPAPDLSGFATVEQVDAVKSMIPELPLAPDLNHLATKGELKELASSLPDWRPQIDESEERVLGEVTALRERMEQHPGKFPILRAWEDGVSYAGTIVTHKGALWQAQKDTGHEPPHDDWSCVAAKGEPGARGASIAWRGTFDPEAVYHAFDIVALDGSSFAAKVDDPGPCPGDGWQLVASRGGRGKPGEGRKGDPGPALSYAEVDENGLVVLTNADGSTVELDLYPILSGLS